jgi:methyl-accepting chemotaxis protein
MEGIMGSGIKNKLRLNIQWKIVLAGLALVAAFIIFIVAYIIPGMANSLMAEKETKTKEAVQVAWSVIDTSYKMEQSGALTHEEAQALAIQEVKNLRYGEDNGGYFWINDFSPTMIMHPIKPEMDGQDQTNYKDPNGKQVFVEFANVARSQGEGFVRYEWQYGTQAGRIEPKISYVKAYQPWDWIVGTGIYTVDVNELISAKRVQYLIIAGIISAVSIVFLFLLSGVISRNIKRVAKTANRLAEGDTSKVYIIKSSDETGEMSESLSRVVGYLNEMAEAAERIAGGDLTVSVTEKSEKDSLGKAFSKMVADLRQLITQLADQATQLASSSSELTVASEQSGSATEQIAASSQQIAKGSEEQTRGINEVKDAVDELAKAIDQVANGSDEQAKAIQQATDIVQQVASAAEQTSGNAQEAANGATQAADVAKQGKATVEKTIEGMRRINTYMQDVAVKISDLGKSSEQIGNMIAVIDDIAAQTNLLALNAAIEAARAGEQGRGFSVVADEVKKLAERTAKETKDIATLVGTVQKGVNESIKASMDGAKQAEEGSEMANGAAGALNQIMDAVNSMTSEIEQILAASEQMSASSTEMVKVIDNISKTAERNAAASKQMTGSKEKVSDSANAVAATTEQNSAATEEMSASAQEMTAQVQQVVASSNSLSNMSKELHNAVNRFNLNGNGHNKNGKETVREIEEALKQQSRSGVKKV